MAAVSCFPDRTIRGLLASENWCDFGQCSLYCCMNTERSRWLWVPLCIAFSGLMLLCGWLIPMHLRAVDVSVLQRAGKNGPSLVERGLALERGNNTDAARLILQAAQDQKVLWIGELASALSNNAENEHLFPGGPIVTPPTPVTTMVVRLEN